VDQQGAGNASACNYRLGREEEVASSPGPVGLSRASRRTSSRQARVDPVAQQGPQPHQRHPVPQQRPQLTHRRRGDPCLRQQVGAQQLRQDRRVDLVVLQPG
jgi:hypothetical protein